MKSDVILGPHYCKYVACTKFDKVICTPPQDISFDIDRIKDDSRFKKYGLAIAYDGKIESVIALP